MREYGGPVRLEHVRIPETIEDNALLVKVRACSVCGTDVHGWQGELTIDADLPAIPGHEMVGEILSFGRGAETDSYGSRLSVGDRVIWTHASCGHCDGCSAGRDSAMCSSPGMYGYWSIHEYPYIVGGFSDHAYVLPGSGRVRVPDEVSDELASVAACAVRSAANGIDAMGTTSVDDVVVVQGSGPVGLFATAMLSKMPRAQLIVVGGPDDRLRVASDFGADATVSIAEYPDAESRRQAILELTGGSSPNRMFEMSGAPTAFSEGLELLARGGQYIIMGQVSGNQVMSRPGRITMKNLEIRGAFSGSVRHYKTALEFLRMHQEEIPFDRIISGRYQLDDVDVVMRRMRDQEEIKPVMIVD